MNAAYWIISSVLLGYTLALKFNRYPYIKKQIPYFTIRYYLGYVLCFFPISCFTTGKVLALGIYNNSNIQNVQLLKENLKDAGIDTLPKKFIGFIGDKLIIGSIDNKMVYVLNQSDFGNIVLIKSIVTNKPTTSVSKK